MREEGSGGPRADLLLHLLHALLALLARVLLLLDLLEQLLLLVLRLTRLALRRQLRARLLLYLVLRAKQSPPPL